MLSTIAMAAAIALPLPTIDDTDPIVSLQIFTIDDKAEVICDAVEERPYAYVTQEDVMLLADAFREGWDEGDGIDLADEAYYYVAGIIRGCAS